MDELRIRSGFMRKLVSKLIESMIYKKLGYKVQINLNDLEVCVTDDAAHINLKAEAHMPINEFKKIEKVINSREEQAL